MQTGNMYTAIKLAMQRFESEKDKGKYPYRAEIRKVYPIEANGDVDAYSMVTVNIEYDALGKQGEACYIVKFGVMHRLYGTAVESVDL